MTHPIENLMQSSLTQIKELADVNTVIGTPLVTEDSTMILPVSKVCMGLLVGGGEYTCLTPVKKSGADTENGSNYPFAGASAVGMCLTPLAFLAVQNGTVRVLPAKQECAAERMVDLIPQTLSTIERLLRELLPNLVNPNGCGCSQRQNQSDDNQQTAAQQSTDDTTD